ncbi:hypothetical protein N9B70_05895, partial [Candidatus Pelagibacter sp.]|nr:hypothetical protein [Candidatus Pelagibacter sp.]
MRIYLIIISTSVFFTVIFIEAYLYNQNLHEVRLETVKKKYFELTKKKYEERTKLQIYTELKNKDFTITIPPSLHLDNKIEIYPLSGISDKKTIFCNNGSYIYYQSDRYGFNNPDEEWNNLSIENFLIGDSFVHGKCVNKPNDISSVLRNLSKKSVINVSYSGNGPLMEYATLKEYLPKNTRNVLWFFYEGNDIENMNHELKSNILQKYFLDKNYIQNLKFKQKEIDLILNSYVEEIYEKKLKNINNSKNKSFFSIFKLSNIRNIFFKSKGQYGLLRSDYSKFSKLAVMIDDFVKKNNSKLYFVFLPEYQRYIFPYNNFNYLKIREIITDLNIPFIDIHKSVFQNEINPLSLFP